MGGWGGGDRELVSVGWRTIRGGYREAWVRFQGVWGHHRRGWEVAGRKVGLLWWERDLVRMKGKERSWWGCGWPMRDWSGNVEVTDAGGYIEKVGYTRTHITEERGQWEYWGRRKIGGNLLYIFTVEAERIVGIFSQYQNSVLVCNKKSI
jgi:hypothetical protein